jgi:hypothetical protein
LRTPISVSTYIHPTPHKTSAGIPAPYLETSSYATVRNTENLLENLFKRYGITPVVFVSSFRAWTFNQQTMFAVVDNFGYYHML